MKILAIETSCDETAIAIAEFHPPIKKNGVGVERARPTKWGARVHVLSHHVSSQIELHARFGGVVPNIARREHEKSLAPMLLSALTEAHLLKKTSRIPTHVSIRRCIEVEEILQRESGLLRQFKKYILPLAPPDIDAIAVTYGPGLAPALWTGVNFSRALAHLWHKPLIPVNHMAGHLFSALLQKRGEKNLQPTTHNLPSIRFPLLTLLVSGGHTELVLVKKPWQFRIIGETRDDAVGEAFDKVARILGLKYPGGPEIARLTLKGNHRAYTLPRPMIQTKDYDFSFSGLKTAVLYLVRDLSPYETWSHRDDLAASFQAAAIEVLIKKTMRAAKEHKIETLVLGGGVAANDALRAALRAALKKECPSSEFQVPSSDLCGDNALMIAAAAYFSGKKKSPEEALLLRADANATIETSMSH